MCPLGLQLPTQLQTRINLGTALKPINVFLATGEITKSGTLNTTFQKPAEEANMYIWFGYVSLTIFNRIQGKVSGSMNDYPINMIHTGQQSTK